jgi:hypothetical protein
MIGKTGKKAYSAIKISKLGSIASMTQAMIMGAYSDGNFMRRVNVTVPRG